MFEKLEKTHLFSGKLYFCTFHKHCEFGNPVSATDIFYGVSALVEGD